MPVYEYECECGWRKAKFLREATGGDDGIPCERCRGIAKKILSYVGHLNKHKGKP